MKFRHNKKRNVALLYEFLIHHMSKCLVENDKEGASKALNISKKYFGKDKALQEELNLFRNVLGTTVSSRHSAEKLINSICESSKKINGRNVDSEKSKLIKEINYSFDNLNFYDYKIPNYVVFASVAALINNTKNRKKTLTEVQRIQLEDVVCEYLISDKKVNLQEDKNPQFTKKVRDLIFEKFHKKYENKLNSSQKRLLTNYAAYNISKNNSLFKEFLTKEVDLINEKLRFVNDKSLREDKEVMEKIKLCSENLKKLDLADINESTILQLLKYMQLVEEIEVENVG